MNATLLEPVHRSPSAKPSDAMIPPLENGDCLTAHEFMRRYEAMPHVNKAELINGVVYMPSPVRVDRHAEPDSVLQACLGFYALRTSGVRSATNGTVRLSPDDVVQPDAFLRVLSELGGQSRVDADGYLVGAPELAMEVAASSVSIDVRQKLQSYRRAGVREYLVWRTLDRAVDWWMLEEDEFRPIPVSDDGTLRSRVFPGLWLHVAALLAEDGAKLVETLQRGLESPEHTAFVTSLRKATTTS